MDSIKEDADFDFPAEGEYMLRAVPIVLFARDTNPWKLIWKNLVFPTGLLAMGAYFLVAKRGELSLLSGTLLPALMIACALLLFAVYARSRSRLRAFVKPLSRYVFTNIRILLISTENIILDCVWKEEVRDVVFDPSGDIFVEGDPDRPISYFTISNVENPKEIFEFVKDTYKVPPNE